MNAHDFNTVIESLRAISAILNATLADRPWASLSQAEIDARMKQKYAKQIARASDQTWNETNGVTWQGD